MVRPLFLFGLGAVAASFALLYSLPVAILCIGISALITLAFVLFRKNSLNKGVLVALIFIILAVRLVAVSVSIDSRSSAIYGKTADITAQIIEIDKSTNTFTSLSLKTIDSSLSEAKGIKLKGIFMSDTKALPGDIISARAVFSKQDDKYSAQNFGEGYYYAAEIEKIYSFDKKSFSFHRIIYNLRTTISSAIERAGKDNEGAVLKALIIGDKSDISEELNTSVRNSGVSHMLVVSGMHLGIVCGVLMNLVKRRLKPFLSVIIGVVSALFILLVCLFHVSILRASIAYIIMLFSLVLKRDADSLSALGFGVIVAVFAMPYIFYNVAFLLSITATFAVLYPAQLLIDAVDFELFGTLGKLFRYVYDILVISLCSMVCILPITVAYFEQIALAAPLTNLAVSLAISLALIIGVFAVLVSFLPLGIYLSVPVFVLARIFVTFFIKAVTFIGKDGFGVIEIDSDKVFYCFLVSIAFVLLVTFITKQIKRKEKNYAKRFDTQIIP